MENRDVEKLRSEKRLSPKLAGEVQSMASVEPARIVPHRRWCLSVNPRLLNAEHLLLLQSTSAHHGHSLPITGLKSAPYIIKADSIIQPAFWAKWRKRP
jgi:hypothetical protein